MFCCRCARSFPDSYELQLPTGGDGKSDVSVLAGPCNTEQTFSSANKGIEGADWLSVPGANEEGGYLLALCEGNNCLGGKEGREPGSGKILVMEKWTKPAAAAGAHAKATGVAPEEQEGDGGGGGDGGSSGGEEGEAAERCFWATAAVLDVPPTAAFMVQRAAQNCACRTSAAVPFRPYTRPQLRAALTAPLLPPHARPFHDAMS